MFISTARLQRLFHELFLILCTAILAVLIVIPAQLVRGEESDRMTGVIAVIDRTAIEMSGLKTLQQLFSDRSEFNVFGIEGLSSAYGIQYLIDGQPMTGLDFVTFPLSSVERIELLREGATRYRGSTDAGTINIVRRKDFDGFEVAGGILRPSRPGLDVNSGSILWGGEIGRGRVLVGFDLVSFEELRDADRDYSRARYGSTMAGSQGVSRHGNTLYYGDQSYAIGDCDPEIYTGALTTAEGEVCGYPYADVAWSYYQAEERENVFFQANQFIDGLGEFYLDSHVARIDTERIYAPTAGEFSLEVNSSLKETLERAIDGLSIDVGDSVRVGHRFTGHGNRTWLSEQNDRGFTLGLRGDLSASVSFETHIRYFWAEMRELGGKFVGEDLIEESIRSGNYDIVNPLSSDPAHLAAVRETTLDLSRDVSRESAVIAAALDGVAVTLPGGPVRWTGGLEFENYHYGDLKTYRDSRGRFHTIEQALGSGGSNVVANREIMRTRAAATFPVMPDLEATLAGHFTRFNDIGSLSTWRLAGRYTPSDSLEFRVHSTRGQASPTVSELYATGSVRFPWARDCRDHPNDLITCTAEVSPVQYKAEDVSNSNLNPLEFSNVGVGATLRFGKLSVAADWHRRESWNLTSRPSAQFLIFMENRGESLPAGAAIVRVGENGVIESIQIPFLARRDNENISERLALGASTEWQSGLFAFGIDLNYVRTLENEVWLAGIKQLGDYSRHRAHAVLRATRGDLSAAWNVHFVSGYYNPARSGRWSSWTGHDLAVQWADAFGKAGLDLTGGVLNIGDSQPSLNAANPNSPSLTYDSARGRSVFLNVALKF